MSKKNTKQIYDAIENHLDSVQDHVFNFSKGDIVTGTIIEVYPSELMVDIGGKSEGVVQGKEMYFDNNRDKVYSEGETLPVYVLRSEDEKGQIKLSIRRTGNSIMWNSLKEAKAKNKAIEVTVLESNTGGVIVDVQDGLRGFIPTSQLDHSRIYSQSSNKKDDKISLQTKLAGLVGEIIKVKIIEIDSKKNRVILSEKLVFSDFDVKKRNETLKRAEIGKVLKGKVTGITPFGLFVNAEGLEGLVHLSEISWDKVSNPADFYKVGDKVEVEIISIDDSGKRIAYSIKRLKTDPWNTLIQGYEIGQVVSGVVQKIVKYGVFIRISEGLNGLIHISELADELVLDPSEVLKIDQEVKVEILSISTTERHLGLSLRRVLRREKEAKKEKN